MNLFSVRGQTCIYAITGVILALWQPNLLYSTDTYAPVGAWLVGGIHGTLAPYTWVVSWFNDCPVKLDNQTAWYGVFWWLAFIGQILWLIIFIIRMLLLKAFK